MKLSLSFLVSFLLLSSHLNFAEGGKKEAKRAANKKGKKKATKAKKEAEKDIENIFLRGKGKGNDVSGLEEDEAEEGDYIVVFKKNKIKNEKTEADFLIREAKGKLKKTYSKALQGFSARLSHKAMNELQNNPDVDYIEEDAQVTITACTTATQSFPSSWGLDRIDVELDDTYNYVEDGPIQEVHVYIIDTGINPDHVDFAGRLGDGFNAVVNEDPVSWEDCHGHGTHVAGIIGGTQYGVAKNVVLHAVRVLNCAGSGYVSDILDGYNWVIEQCTNPEKICVANGSFGGSLSQASNDGASSLVDAGVVYAVAAGNENIDSCERSPASAQGVITVGATTITDARSGYSCYGKCVEIFAPVRTKLGIFCTEIVSILFLRA
jgi:subtilisin family serine protease